MSAAPSITPDDLAAIASEVVDLALQRVRQDRGAAQAIRTKSSATDVVTATDLAVESLIREELTARAPASSILGEEGGQDHGVADVGWIVDPVDGTVNFLYDLPIVAISIAATLHGDVVAGAVGDVASGEIFSAVRDRGAWCDGHPIRVNRPTELSQALVITGFSYDASVRPRQAALIAKVVGEVRDIRCFGSAALHLCWVACGRADAYWEADVQRWDVAAGALIAEEAGATVLTPWTTSSSLTLASAPTVHEALHALVGPSHGGLRG